MMAVVTAPAWADAMCPASQFMARLGIRYCGKTAVLSDMAALHWVN